MGLILCRLKISFYQWYKERLRSWASKGRGWSTAQKCHWKGMEVDLHKDSIIILASSSTFFEAETPVRAQSSSVSSGNRHSQAKATSTYVLCSVLELKQNRPWEQYKASETSLSFLWRLHCKPGTRRYLQLALRLMPAGTWTTVWKLGSEQTAERQKCTVWTEPF